MARKTPEQLAQEFEGRKAKGLAKGGAAFWPNIIANAVLKLTQQRVAITPETLIEIMVLCYRMLFVFSDALHSTRTAQAARLGYATPRLALRSLGSLTAGLTLQIWQRAHDLHIAAQSRNNDGALRFLEPEYPSAQRDMTVAVFAACALILIAAVLR